MQVRVEPAQSVFEGTSLTLTCEASGGNPIVQYYSWSFKPRYKVSSELSSNNKRKLEFDSVQYTQAGLFRCEAENRAGVGSDSKEIFVHCKYDCWYSLLYFKLVFLQNQFTCLN